MFTVRNKSFVALWQALDYVGHERKVSKLAGTDYVPSVICDDDGRPYGQLDADGVFRTFEISKGSGK